MHIYDRIEKEIQFSVSHNGEHSSLTTNDLATFLLIKERLKEEGGKLQGTFYTPDQDDIDETWYGDHPENKWVLRVNYRPKIVM